MLFRYARTKQSTKLQSLSGALILKNMNTWEPISESHLLGLIEVSEYEMYASTKLVWERIRLPEPEKWHQSSMGVEGGGFWVVATYGKTCLYYNDIEDGFNESPFNEWGTIDEYWCNQIGLHHYVSSVFTSKA